MNTLVKILTTTCITLTLIFIVGSVIVSNQLATMGTSLHETEAEIVKEQEARQALETQVASASSLLTVRARAQELGFREPTTKQIVTLTLDVPVALGTNTTP